MKRILDNALEKLLIVLFSLMVINVTWQVVSRYIFNSPSTLTDELSRYALIWLGLFGAAYATGKGLHLAIDLLPGSLNKRNAAMLSVFIHLMVIIFALGVMVIGGINLSSLTFLLEQRSATLNIPLGYIYLAIPTSGFVIVLYSVNDIFKILSR